MVERLKTCKVIFEDSSHSVSQSSTLEFQEFLSNSHSPTEITPGKEGGKHD